MFIKYDESDLLEFFESEPQCIGDVDVGDMIYSYQTNPFKIILLISTYEMRAKISIIYNEHTLYSQKYNNVLEIKKDDFSNLRVLMNQDRVVIIKKHPQVGVVVE